ncbi:hypothetical protein [Alkalicoccobacillus porphyridii]|uniref:Uncharacterized protein n=1 Tax=Alkalicoccobacillus porphyridii TaxID=2597270 RepID=A0A553ZX28_9BACI|nr:hypothetical protein [Alkalicoccobacillus porphyridii]TSB46004.1 hypothetical protein FN960_13965 [Alkalicoccobacillus porphyridii]
MINPFLAGVLILMAIAVDMWVFDQDQKRWGWLKGWPKAARVSVFVGLVIIMTVFWVAVSWKYI